MLAGGEQWLAQMSLSLVSVAIFIGESMPQEKHIPKKFHADDNREYCQSWPRVEAFTEH